MISGYYRFPTIHQDTVIFVSEDDLWVVPSQGGIARRLTSNLAITTRPLLSPDGQKLAFVGREEGNAEIYIMPSMGGQFVRLTYMGATRLSTAAWDTNGNILFSSNTAQPFPALRNLYRIHPENPVPEKLNIGPANTIAFGPDKQIVIGRNTNDPAHWKRYRGGTTGQLWIDIKGNNHYKPLIQLDGNLSAPMWIGNLIFFISDHEGIGNLYSCSPSGTNVTKHTHHSDFYARNPSTDGKRVVYHAGADLFIYDPTAQTNQIIPIEFYSPRVQRNRKYVTPSAYLETADLNPKGHSIALTSRGKLFSFHNWEGPVTQKEEDNNGRYRLPTWLNDGEQILAVTDSKGEERLVIFHPDSETPHELLPELDIGRPLVISANPQKNQILLSNHRYELLTVDLDTHEIQHIDKGESGRIAGFSWSPDGEWVVYSASISLQVSIIKLWNATTKEITEITKPVLRDISPTFDPGGKFIYFLSYRTFDPVYDNLHFDLNFPNGMKPYLITLQKNTPSPFISLPKTHLEQELEDEDDEDKENQQEVEDLNSHEEQENNEDKDQSEEMQESEPEPIQIDLEGIQERIIEFPVSVGRYGKVIGIDNNNVLYTRYTATGVLSQSNQNGSGNLYKYNFEEQKEESLLQNISDFESTADGKSMIVSSGKRLRVLKAGSKPKETTDAANIRSGWIDLNSRIKLSINPADEWQQMFREAWRLQRDHFWNPDMSNVDWVAIYERYLPLLDRISSRSEFSDLMWEMQGELGTSHAYESGGDYRSSPQYRLGFLAADFTFDTKKDGWRITHIVKGDAWDEKCDSPLNNPGINLPEEPCLLAINNQKLTSSLPPSSALVNLAGNEISLTFANDCEEEPRTRVVIVKTLKSETPARYREWVNNNRELVHKATSGKVGYLHIPDMKARGYAEFHRGFLAEIDRQGLIIDIRFNTGGNVSELILEKLSRRRIGYEKSRWSQLLEPYPRESVLGPMVTLINEHTGSDGDIFATSFRTLNLGKLIGTRTWGGVIGIHPRHPLVDKTLTTQPEFSHWFFDQGWNIENYGVEPDITINNRPQDYSKKHDAQLQRAIKEIIIDLEKNPPIIPELNDSLDRSLPTLPN